MRIHHLSRCRFLKWRVPVVVGIFAFLAGCPASPTQTTPAKQAASSASQTQVLDERFTQSEPVAPSSSDAPSLISAAIPAKPKPVELPDEESLDEQGLSRIDAAPFIFISDLRVDQLQPIIDTAPALIVTWDQTFGPMTKAPTWVVFIMEKVEPFKRLNLLPRDGAAVPHGLQLEDRVWIRVQETEYYTRHLFLHEATHARMMAVSQFQGDGTLWFHEGIAEYIATHIIDTATLRIQLTAWPRDPRQLPGWNHFTKLQEANKADRTSTLPWILAYQADSYRRRDGQPYADSWALCQFLSLHPQYRDALSRCLKSSNWESVLQELTEPLLKDSTIQVEWLAWLAAISPRDDSIQPVVSLPSMEAVTLAPFPVQTWVDSSSGQLSGGPTEIKVDGRVKIRVKDREVSSGPDGVTVEYRHGYPLGAVLGVITRRDLKGQVANPFSHPRIIGERAKFDMAADESLYLSINQLPQSIIPDQPAYRVRIPASE
jgi:hypothetical protein